MFGRIQTLVRVAIGAAVSIDDVTRSAYHRLASRGEEEEARLRSAYPALDGVLDRARGFSRRVWRHVPLASRAEVEALERRLATVEAGCGDVSSSAD